MKHSSTNTDVLHTKTIATQVNGYDIDSTLAGTEELMQSAQEKGKEEAHMQAAKTVKSTPEPAMHIETDPDLLLTPSCSKEILESDSSDYSDEYVMNPDDIEGHKIYEKEGVSLTYLHGVFYTPPGFKHIRVKRARANADPGDRLTAGTSSQVKKKLHI